jgi:hypothetical protein
LGLLSYRSRSPSAKARSGRSGWRLAIAAVLGAAFGCDAFDSDRHPYTPFPVISGNEVAPPPEPAESTAQPRVALVPAPNAEALVAPALALEWRIAGRQLVAPDGLAFGLGLVGGIEGGGASDVLAWLVGTEERPVVGELWFYPENGPARLIRAAPGFLPTGASCSHSARLTHAGVASVILDVKAVCPGPLLPRAPVRSVSLLAPMRPQPKIIAFQLAAPAAEEDFDLSLISEDRDKDGRDDVEMLLRLKAVEGSEVQAGFVWLDRPAGLSRDTTEPLASFSELAALDSVRAGDRKSSAEVAEHVASARRLYSSLCAESGVPRVFLDSGAELDCGSLQAPFQAFTAASVQAALNLGQVGNAYAALEQHGWFPSGSAADREKFLGREAARISPFVTRRRVIKLVPLQAQPRSWDGGPHFSPLSFHADGSLLLLTPDGLVRAAPDGRYEYDASDEVDAWDMLIVSPAGERLTGIAFPCDRSEVSWIRTTPDGAGLAPLPTTLIAPRPGACRGGTPFVPPAVSPAGWSSEGVSAFVGLSFVGPPPAQAPMGGAFSPNGRFTSVMSRWGLWVAGGDKPAIWVFDNPALLPRLSDCVVSNNAQAAACILDGRAYVILPDPRTG